MRYIKHCIKKQELSIFISWWFEMSTKIIQSLYYMHNKTIQSLKKHVYTFNSDHISN